VTASCSDHFVLSAVIYRDTNLGRTTQLLAELRSDLGRQPGQRLHWKGFRTRPQRLYAAHTLGHTNYIKIVSVVVCKRFLPPTMPHEHASYLYTFRLLLERLSWLAQDERTELSYTLSHVRRFPLAKLRQYEVRLRALGDETTIRWQHLDPHGGRLDADTNLEQLQLADLAASATAEAFELKPNGTVDRRYLTELAPRLYRSTTPGRMLTSYGLKMHPWNPATRAAYPWVLTL
jgi:hypothetical protein